jgi:hypothetical protein
VGMVCERETLEPGAVTSDLSRVVDDAVATQATGYEQWGVGFT